MRQITIKYDGNCKRCDKPLVVGQTAIYEKSMGCFCIGCEPRDTEEIRQFRLIRAQKKAERLMNRANRLDTEAQDKTSAFNHFRGDYAFITQPGHIPFRDKIIKRYNKGMELHQEAQDLRERAENITNVRVKGDAERRYQAKRLELDKVISIGSRVHSALHGDGVIEKINTKSLKVKLDSGYTITADKIYFESIV